jgi:hypothetical protein
MTQYGIEQCPCGHRACKTYFLTGIGRFVQGSGFTKDEAEHLVRLLNEKPLPEGADVS